MAKQVLTQLVDDVDGEPADYEAFEFSLDGKSYELDLSQKNVVRLEELLDPFITAARRVSRRQGPAKRKAAGRQPSADRERTRAIREWARGRGIPVADRGRIPASVMEAYPEGRGPVVSVKLSDYLHAFCELGADESVTEAECMEHARLVAADRERQPDDEAGQS